MNKTNPMRPDLMIGLGIAMSALLAYLFTLSPCAYPGESGMMIAQYSGILPKLTPDFPIWHGLVRLAARLPFGTLACRINIMSAVFGSLAVWLIYSLTSGLLYAAMPVNEVSGRRLRVLARFSAAMASAYIAFCAPFWFSSNKGHPATFHIAYALWLAMMLVRYAEKPSAGCLAWFAFFYGLGVVEYATLIIFAPLAGIVIVLILWRREMLSLRSISPVFIAPLAALSFYFAVAWVFHGTQCYHIRGYDSFFQIVWFMWRDQLYLIGQSVLQSGWLIVAITIIMPWLTVLATARQSFNQDPEWGYILLHVLMSAVVVGILFGADFSPWAIMGHGHIPIMP